MKQRESILYTLNPDQLTGIIKNLNHRINGVLEKMKAPDLTLTERRAMTHRWSKLSAYRIDATAWRYEQVAR